MFLSHTEWCFELIIHIDLRRALIHVFGPKEEMEHSSSNEIRQGFSPTLAVICIGLQQVLDIAMGNTLGLSDIRSGIKRIPAIIIRAWLLEIIIVEKKALQKHILPVWGLRCGSNLEFCRRSSRIDPCQLVLKRQCQGCRITLDIEGLLTESRAVCCHGRDLTTCVFEIKIVGSRIESVCFDHENVKSNIIHRKMVISSIGSDSRDRGCIQIVQYGFHGLFLDTGQTFGCEFTFPFSARRNPMRQFKESHGGCQTNSNSFFGMIPLLELCAICWI